MLRAIWLSTVLVYILQSLSPSRYTYISNQRAPQKQSCPNLFSIFIFSLNLCHRDYLEPGKKPTSHTEYKKLRTNFFFSVAKSQHSKAKSLSEIKLSNVNKVNKKGSHYYYNNQVMYKSDAVVFIFHLRCHPLSLSGAFINFHSLYLYECARAVHLGLWFYEHKRKQSQQTPISQLE